MLQATAFDLGDVISEGITLMLDRLQETIVPLVEQDRHRYFEEMLDVFRAANMELPPVEDEEE